jgi:hypothetical protein
MSEKFTKTNTASSIFPFLRSPSFLRRRLSTDTSGANSVDTKIRKIADKLDTVSGNDDGITTKDILENLRIALKNFYLHSWIGKAYNFFMLVLSILSVLEYIYTTYLSLSVTSELAQYNALKVSEVGVASLFAFDWLLSFLLADHKMLFLSSFYSMVDLMTVIPIFTTVNESCPSHMKNAFDYSFQQIVFYILCGMNTTRILRALRIHRPIEEYVDDDVQKCLSHMALNIVVMILFSKLLTSSCVFPFLTVVVVVPFSFFVHLCSLLLFSPFFVSLIFSHFLLFAFLSPSISFTYYLT